MHLDNFNLNLLVALDAILAADTLTQAAVSLCVTQSAMSISLRKLRSHFADELVIYTVGRKKLTPLARRLQPQIGEIVWLSREALRSRGTVDPLTLNATFRISTLEALEVTFLPIILRSIGQKAPRVKVLASPFDFRALTAPLSSDLDLAIVTEDMSSPRMETEVLFAEEFACIVCADHPSVGDTISLAQYHSLPHAAIELGPIAGQEAFSEFLEEAYGKVNIAVVTSTFAALVHIVIGTELVALLPRSLAVIYAQKFSIRLLALPFPAPTVKIVAQWRSYRGSDPAMLWLLDRVRDAARHLQGVSAA